jgi:hypothetical protein
VLGVYDPPSISPIELNNPEQCDLTPVYKMPVITRSMKTLTAEDLEITEILCKLKESQYRSRKNAVDYETDADSEYVPSDDEDEEYTPPTQRSRKNAVDYETDADSEYVPSDDEDEGYTPPTQRSRKNTVDYETDADSEYVPSDDEDEEYTPPTQRSRKNAVDETDADDSEYVPSDEDYADGVIREGCSAFSLGAPLDPEFFRVCKRTVRGDYSPEFTRWALQIQPVRAVAGVR